MSRFIRPGIIRPTVVFLLVFGFPQPGTQSLAQQRQGGQSNPSGTLRSGDVFSNNGQGRRTRTTGTQGVNHGKGGNKTCQTTRNTPNYNPNTCTAGDVFASNSGSNNGSNPKGGGLANSTSVIWPLALARRIAPRFSGRIRAARAVCNNKSEKQPARS